MDHHHHSLKDLIETLRSLESYESVLTFLEDLCTPAELESLADRWLVAQKVAQGQPYRQIQQETGVSTATITRVARCVTYGSGYQKALLQKGLQNEKNETLHSESGKTHR